MIKQVFDEQDLPMDVLREIGLVDGDKLKLSENDLRALLSGRITAMLHLKNLMSGGIRIPNLEAKLSLAINPLGNLDLLVHPFYPTPVKPSFLTDEEAQKLEKGEVPNIDKMIFDDNGDPQDVLVEFDKETNEFIVLDEARILAPDRVNGQYLSLDQKERYRKGKEVELQDGTTIQYSVTEKNGVRSNKLAFIASVLIDGGLSFTLYHGLNALFGQKKHREDADVYSKGYYEDLEKMQEQSESERHDREREKQFTRSYTRTGSR
jgi:hypothetical protein